MKTMTIVAVAAALIAGPTFAQSQAAPASPAAANVPAVSTAALAPPNKTDQSKDWTVGMKVPVAFTVTSRYAVNDYESYSLPKPNYGSAWLVVGDNAYLVRTANNLITKVVGVTPKG